VFSVQANADDAAVRLRAAGVPASVQVEQAGGRDVWRVVASPAGEDGDAEATIVRIKASGFVDAFVVDGEES
ncbi:MAG: SPOR domain-containing protein, partial [Pseudomonadota bacterium]